MLKEYEIGNITAEKKLLQRTTKHSPREEPFSSPDVPKKGLNKTAVHSAIWKIDGQNYSYDSDEAFNLLQTSNVLNNKRPPGTNSHQVSVHQSPMK